MKRVENFHDFNLYQRSLDLVKDIYNATQNGNLLKAEANLIRKKSVAISSLIASAIAQANMKVRFKRLNEAKGILIQIRLFMLELKIKNKIDSSTWGKIEKRTIEVMKLLNAFFGYMKKSKYRKIRG